jgi:long-chain fatty acid transport protein
MNTQSIKAMSMGGSLTGVALDASSSFYNPGSISFLDKNYINGGIAFTLRESAFLGVTGVQEESKLYLKTPFYLNTTYHLKNKFSLALSINTPFNYGVKWQENWSGRYIAETSYLSSIYIQPTVSYKINKHIALGVAPIFTISKIGLTKSLPLENQNSTTEASSELKGSGNGFGFNVGLYTKFNKLSIGISSRSSINIKVKKGTIQYNNLPSSQIAIGTYPNSSEITTQYNLPSEFSVGIGYQLTSKLLLVANFNSTNWKNYESLSIKVKDFPSLDQEIKKEYKSTIALRIGSQYKFNSKLNVMAGVAYDQSPIQDGYLSPELPDANSLVLSAGFTYLLKKTFSIEGSFVYQRFKERKEDQQSLQVMQGTYKSYIYLPAIGLQYAF